jgi:hypothetical protein
MDMGKSYVPGKTVSSNDGKECWVCKEGCGKGVD